MGYIEIRAKTDGAIVYARKGKFYVPEVRLHEGAAGMVYLDALNGDGQMIHNAGFDRLPIASVDTLCIAWLTARGLYPQIGESICDDGSIAL